MKKSFFSLVVLVFVFLIAGCATSGSAALPSTDSRETTAPSASASVAETLASNTVTDYDFTYQWINVACSGSYPEELLQPKLIRSPLELDDFYANYAQLFMLDQNTQYHEAVKEFTEEYFQKNTLFFNVPWPTTSSILVEIDSVQKTASNSVLANISHYGNIAATQGYCYRFLFISIPEVLDHAASANVEIAQYPSRKEHYENLGFKYLYHTVGGAWTVSDDTHPNAVIHSKEALSALLRSGGQSLSDTYLNVFERYDSAFFQTHTLVLICFEDTRLNGSYLADCSWAEQGEALHIDLHRDFGKTDLSKKESYTVLVELETLLPEHTDVVIELHT